jgi:phospholipid/cholesterol/gamma-HCH transport system substrate-binding protein
MHGDDKFAVRVGALMLLAIATAATLVLVFDHVQTGHKIKAHVEFSHLGGLREGADVQVAGQIIGEVGRIELVRSGVIAHVRIDTSRAYMAPVNGDWFVSYKGIVGERYIEVGPALDGSPPARPVQDGDVIRGFEPPQIDRLANASLQSVLTMRWAAEEFGPAARELAGALDETFTTLDKLEPYDGAYWNGLRAGVALYDEAGKTTEFWRQSDTTLASVAAIPGRAAALLAYSRHRLDGLQSRFDQLRSEVDRLAPMMSGEQLSKFERVVDQSRALMAQVRSGLAVSLEMLAMIEAGQGTLGALLQDVELRDSLKEALKLNKRQFWRLIGHRDMDKLKESAPPAQ